MDDPDYDAYADHPFAEVDLDSEAKRFHSIRIIYDSAFDINAYVDIVADPSAPYLCVKHVHPKRGGHHWHLSCVIKGGHGKHLPKKNPDLSPHGGSGNPIQCKPKLYDIMHFQYLIKPKEYVHDDCIVATNISDDDICDLSIRSQAYLDDKKNEIPDLVKGVQRERATPFKDFYLKSLIAVCDHLNATNGVWQPQYKYRILMCIYREHEDYRASIATALGHV